jgi:RHS repeat-associated protein
LTKTIDGANKAVAVTYDNANNLKTLTDASNRVTTYNYDAKNQLDTVKQGTATIADYDWYADGLLKKVSYQNTTTRDYVYDNANRVTNITNRFGNSQSESFDYGYDANSNRSSEIRKSNGQAFRTIAYSYDKVDRLTDADYTGNVQTPNPPNNQTATFVENTNFNKYGYDGVGNRTLERNKSQSKTITLTTDGSGATTRTEQVSTSPETTTAATFDSLNQLTQLNEPNAVSNFSYDNNGNLSQVSKNASVINRYEYDIRNQLTKAKDGNNNELAKFDYDFERKRISKQGANGYESYVYAGNQIVNEYNAFGDSKAKYTIGAGEVVKSEFAGGESNFHFTDALGSTTSLANATGSLTNRNEYNAFGEQFTNANNAPTANSIGYTGQRLDNETGLMALGNGERYYSPQYARFIQQDSWLGNNSMPQSANRFAYGYNNPFSYRDLNENEPDAVQQGFRDARQQLANNSTGNWYFDFAANFYLGMYQSGYSAIKGFYNAGKEVLNMAADAVTYVAADAMGIELKDMKFSSKMAQGIQEQRMSGRSAWDIATDKNVVANVLTLGVYGTIQNAAGNALDYSEGKISLDEYNEKMGEMAGEQLFDLATMGVGKGKQVVKAAEESTTALKTTFKSLARGEREAVGNLKRSIKEAVKPFEKFSFGELKNKIKGEVKAGFSREEAVERVRGGKVCFVAGTLVHTKDGAKKIEV